MKPLSRRTLNILSLYFIITSLFGLGLLAIATFNDVSVSATSIAWQKELVSPVFGVICLIGLILGISPSKVSHSPFFRSLNEISRDVEQANIGKKMIFRGHHPVCGKFSTHVIRIWSKTYCAGCTGLVLGAAASLLGIILLSSTDLYIGEASILLFWLGFAGVVFGLLQFNLFFLKNGFGRVIINVIFVLGTFLLLIGVNEAPGSFIIQCYFLALTIYLILVRIILSRREHMEICASCSLKSCYFL